MRVKSKILKAIISSVLAVSMIATVSIQVFAGASSDGGGSGSSLGGSGYGNLLNPDDGALKILPSTLDNDAKVDNLKNFSQRYGAMYEYPLLMQTGYTDSKPNNDKSWFNWVKTPDENSDYTKSTNYINAIKEYNHMLSYSGTRDIRKEFLSYSSNGSWFINSYCGKSYNNSVFIEDYIKDIMNSKSFNNSDKDAFWYFYSRIKQGVLNDTSIDGSRSTLGSSLGNAMKSVQTVESRRTLFINGYKVAVKAIYGGIIDNGVNVANKIYAFVDNNVRNCKVNSTDVTYDFTDKGMKSFLIERLQGVKPAEVGSRMYFSVQSYITASWGNGKMSTKDLREGWYRNGVGNCTGIGYDFGPSFIGNKNNSDIDSETHQLLNGGLFGRLFPVAVNTDKDANGKSQWIPNYDTYSLIDADKDRIQAFGGWAFYPIGDQSPDVTELLVYEPDKVNLGTEVTYNAYLSSDSDLGESDAFGENGRVMTDTVYFSKPEYMGKDSSVFKNNPNKRFSDVTVDSSISLSTPAVGTTYDLYRMGYRITGANGSYPRDISNGFTSTSNLKISKDNTEIYQYGYSDIAIFGKQILSALDDSSSITYKQRKKVSLAGSNIYNSDFDLYKVSNGSYVKCAKTTAQITSEYTPSGKNLGTFDEDDVTVKSINPYYIKANNSYTPVYFDGDNWYYLPIIKVTNLLIQVRADYKASYDKDDKDLFKSATMPEYLLAENKPTNNFLATKLYAFLDNYTNNVWGTTFNRSFVSRSEKTGEMVSLTGVNNDKTSYYYAENKVWKDIGGTLAKVAQALNNHRAITYNGVTTSVSKGEWIFNNDSDMSRSIYKTDQISANRQKIEYIDLIMKSAPKLVAVDTSKDDIKKYSYVNSKLSVNLGVFDENNKSVTAAKGDSRVDTYPSIGYTAENGNGKVSQIKTPSNYQYPAEMVVKAFSNDGLTGINISNRIFSRTSDGQNVTDRTKNIQRGYREAVFAKVVLSYNAYTYTKRAEKSPTSTPNVASWLSDSNIKSASTFGLSNDFVSTSGKTIKKQDGVYTGFYRFGSAYFSNGDTFVRNNTDDVNSSVTFVRTSPYGLSSTKNTNCFAEPFTQSSYDVPVTINFNAYTPDNKTATPPSTDYSTSGSTLTESAYTGTKLNVYPEVTMWAENQKKNTGDVEDTTYTSIVTVGQKKRNIPIVAYNTLNLTTPKHNPSITGTAIAFDTRAKRLAESLGASKAPVFYSGSGINVAIDKTTVGSVSTYYLDIGNSSLKAAWGNSDIAAKSLVANFANRLSATVATKVDIKNGDTIVKTLDFGGEGGKKDCSIKVDDPVSNGETINLTVKGGILTKISYNWNKGGTNSGSISYTVNNADTDSTSLTFSGGSIGANTDLANSIAVKLLNILKGTKVVGENNMLMQSLQNGGGNNTLNGNIKNWLNKNSGSRFTTSAGWYMEDTSVLVIKGYETNLKVTGATYTDQIPLNLGPATPADKNNYFSNGYKGIINSTYEFSYKKADGTVIPSVFQTSTFNNKADFIVADVTINDATTY